ncbi:MAG: DUF4351 domain-containing protein [Crocosphaera sp.]
MEKFPNIEPEIRTRIQQLSPTQLQNLQSQLPQINSHQDLLDWLDRLDSN